MNERQRIIMTEADIDRAIQRIALQILERNHDVKELALVGIHTCGVFLAERLSRFLEKQDGPTIYYGTLDINLYRDDWSLNAQNPVVRTTDISFPVDGGTLVLVDDVLFTGRTIRAAMDALWDYGRPQSIQLAVLVDRGGRELPIHADFIGMQTAVLDYEHIQVLFSENSDRNAVLIEG